MLSSNYKQPFDWNDKILTDSYKTLNKWYEFYSDTNCPLEENLAKWLRDDLNTPKYISEVHKLYDEAIKGSKDAGKQLSSACKLLGLFDKNFNTWNKNKITTSLTDSEIENLIKERNLARNNKDFKKSDEIRGLLNDKGVVIEDSQNKTTWKYK